MKVRKVKTFQTYFLFAYYILLQKKKKNNTLCPHYSLLRQHYCAAYDLTKLKKCQNYGIGLRILAWITYYPTDRLQNVKVGAALSNHCSVLSGIPQSSCVGPVL